MEILNRENENQKSNQKKEWLPPKMNNLDTNSTRTGGGGGNSDFTNSSTATNSALS